MLNDVERIIWGAPLRLIIAGGASPLKGSVGKAEIPSDMGVPTLMIRPKASLRCISIIYLLLHAVTTWKRQGDDRGIVLVTARELADSPERRHPGKDELAAQLFPSLGRALTISTSMEIQSTGNYPQGIPGGRGE